MHKILLFLFLSIPFGVFAESVDIIADVPSGTYHSPVLITLTATQSGAKIFYSLKPDGTPNDAILYTKPFLLKYSSPFIYFSFINTSNESKIKQNNYIIDYPATIHFESEFISGSGKKEISLVNNGESLVDIGFWYIQSESEMITIPEGTTIKSKEKYSVVLNYTGNSSIVLRTPDGEERDILISKKEEILPVVTPHKQKQIIIKTVPRESISITETSVPVAILPHQESTSLDSEAGEKLKNTQNIISPKEIISEKPSPIDINKIVKASAQESGQKGINPMYFFLFFIVSLGAGGIRWFVRKK